MNDYYKLILSRIDTYILSINTKGGLIVAFCTFLIGGVVAKYPDIEPIINKSNTPVLIHALLVGVLFLDLFSVLFVGLAVFPYLKSGNSSTKKYHSLMFFNSITEFQNADEYNDALKNQSEEDDNKDIANQIFILSKGIKIKFRRVAWAMRLFLLSLISIAIIILLIFL